MEISRATPPFFDFYARASLVTYMQVGRYEPSNLNTGKDLFLTRDSFSMIGGLQR